MRLNVNYVHLQAYSLKPAQSPAALGRVLQAWLRLKVRLSHAVEILLGSINAGYEPKVVKKQDPQGNSYFHVYDPVNAVHHRFASEEEVRIWLDRRYYL